MIRLVIYIGDSQEIGRRSEARASDLGSHPGLWWNPVKLLIRLYEGYESEHSPRTCSIGRPAGDTLCLRPIPLRARVTPPPLLLAAIGFLCFRAAFIFRHESLLGSG